MPPSARRAARRRSVVLVLLLSAVLSGCQVSVATDVTVATDGSGTVTLHVLLDEDLASSLAADDLDVFAGLEELPQGWSSERIERDGGRGVTVSAPFADPAELSARVDQLRNGLDAEDPLLVDGLELTVDDGGAASLEGRAGFRPPSSTGLRGAGVGFDGEDLLALLEERGDEVLRVDLRVTMPGPIVDANADEVDGRTATWHLPVTELTTVEVRSAAPSLLQRWLPVAAAALVGLALGFVGLRVVARWRMLRRRG